VLMLIRSPSSDEKSGERRGAVDFADDVRCGGGLRLGKDDFDFVLTHDDDRKRSVVRSADGENAEVSLRARASRSARK